VADWQAIVIQVPGKDFLEPVREVLETLLVYLEILKALLETIKTFLIDFGNPIKALVEALLALIQELLNALKVSGFFAYFDIPDPTIDPNFDSVFGGFDAFTERFKGSLYDTKDFNRPQPRQGSTKSGFVLLVVEAEAVFGLLKLIKQLMRFFGKDFSSPRYEAVGNFKALPVGDSGDPILAVTSIFTTEIEAIQLSWTLPSSQETPDPGFSDVVTKMAAEFVPPSFLVERSDVAPTRPLNASSGSEFSPINLAVLHDPDLTGVVEYDRTTEFTVQGFPGKRVKRREGLIDDQAEPIIKFNKYTLIDGVEVESILGQLGTFRYIDTDVEIGKTYFYRVRPYSGPLDLVELTNGQSFLNWAQADPPGFNPELGTFVMKWPSKDPEDPIIMGKPTAILSVTIPKTIPDFDVIEVLKRLFQTAFSLDFQLPLAEDAEFGDDGLPINNTSPIQVGRSSMMNLAGMLGAFQSFPIIGLLAGVEAVGPSIPEEDFENLDTTNSTLEQDPITGRAVDMPWQKASVRRQSARLALAVAGALLEAGENALVSFRDYMQGPFPSGTPTTPELLQQGAPPSLIPSPNLEKVIFSFTFVDEDDHTDVPTARRYVEGYADPIFRLNVLTVINFLKSFTLGGVPPDWISIVPLRDIIPWSAQIIYDILDAIQKLLNAFQGVIDEIRAFIDLLIRKIDAMERFIEFLIEILNFIDSLQVGAYILSATGITGDASEWANIVDSAGGDRPPSRPGGYSAGVAFGYVAIDVAAFEAAFNIIF
jgi:hypothetical protein